MRRYLILAALLLIPLIPLGLLAFGVIKRPVTQPKPVTLTVWVTSDTAKQYNRILAEYSALRPYITVRLTQVPRDDYAVQLKDAWARGRGPDVFELPVEWLGEFADDFLLPAPATTNVYTYFKRKAFFRQQTDIQQTAIASITPAQLQRDFVDVVQDDVIRDGKIYGLPTSIDTLVLYYNKDVLRSANVVEPPRTWTQLTQMAPKLTIADEEGRILQSAIAIGTGANVEHASDIISLLFLQDGVTMNGPAGRVLLDESIAADGTNLGENALSFYTSFANKGKDVYSWNADQPNSLEAFLAGKAAMYIGYHADRTVIDARGSISYGVAPIPHLQADGKDALLTPSGNPLQVNFGNYTVFSVFQRTKAPNEAWNFAQYLTRDERLTTALLAGTGRPGALRSILQKQLNDESIRVFAEQAVSARTWYRGRNASEIEQRLTEMLDAAASGRLTALEALTLARKQIEQTSVRR